MRKSQKALVKISETRERVNRLAGKPPAELTEEERAALATDTEELFRLEAEYRTAVAEEAAADVEADAQRQRDGEGAELRQLQDRVRVGRYASYAARDRRLEGAEAEFNEARGLADDGIVQLPFDLLAPAEHRAEQRQDAPVNIGPGRSDPIRQGRWLTRLFEMMRAGYIGVTTEAVASGEVAHYLFGSNNAAVQRARGEAVDGVAATVSVVEMKPKRMAGRYVFRVEDATQIERLETGIRMDLQALMAVGMDRKIFAGDAGATGDAADIVGLLTAAGVTALAPAGTRNAQGIVGSKFLAAVAGLIDGVRATSLADIATLVGLGPNEEFISRDWAGGNNSEKSIGQVMGERGLTFTTATTDQLGAGTDTTPVAADQLVAVGSLARYREGAAVAAVWPSVSLIRDPYTGAAAGEVALTATALWDFKIVRPGQFWKLTAKA